MFFTVVENITKQIMVHSDHLTIKKKLTKVRDKNEKELKILSQTYDEDRQWWKIMLSDEMYPNKNYSIELTFEGFLTDSLAGFYRSKYVDKKTKKTKYLATTQFQPTDARRAFPCQDEPAKKATFNITLIKKKGYTALSNTEMLYEKKLFV